MIPSFTFLKKFTFCFEMFCVAMAQVAKSVIVV